METKYLERAIELARRSIDNGGGPFGAVIVKDGKVVAETSNSVTMDNDPTAHAEVNCIRKACRELGTFVLEGCDIYASSEPCPMCFGAIYWAHIGRIFYAATREDAAWGGFDDDFIYKEIATPAAARRVPSANMLRPEGRQVFAVWRGKSDKVDY